MAKEKLKRYRVTYQDICDPDNRHTTIIRGTDPDYVYERFYEGSAADEGWELVKIERLPEASS